MQYVIMYVRLTDDKKAGISFNGPWFGSTEYTKTAAEFEISKLVAESKGSAIIAKIFELYNDQYSEVRKIADRYFDRIKKEMNESKEMLDRPVTHRKKKKHYKIHKPDQERTEPVYDEIREPEPEPEPEPEDQESEEAVELD